MESKNEVKIMNSEINVLEAKILAYTDALPFIEDEREYNITFDKVTAMQQRVYELLLENNA